VRALDQLRPELEIEQVRTMCQGAIALIQSATEFGNKLTREQLEPILLAMAMHVLIDTPIPPLTPAPGRGDRTRGTRAAGAPRRRSRGAGPRPVE
jgi:hypothetical protein